MVERLNLRISAREPNRNRNGYYGTHTEHGFANYWGGAIAAVDLEVLAYPEL